MDSISVKDFSYTIRKFIDGYELPMEVKRLALFEIYEEYERKSNTECFMQAQARESKQEENNNA